MNSLEDLFQQAQLAEATYANFSVAGAIEALQDINTGGAFSAAQAAAFVDQWTIIDQYTAPSFPNLTGSGFSATVFKNKATGQYTFAIRGTEATNLSDWAADIFGIGGKGIASRQALDLYNYRKSLDTPLGQAYQAAYFKTDLAETALLTPLWTAAQLSQVGLTAYNVYRAELESHGFWVDGAIVSTLALGSSTTVAAVGLEGGRQSANIGLGAGYDVVGHSLGGHLAMVLGRLDGSNVASIETFNPIFFDPFGNIKLSERLFKQLQKLEKTAFGYSAIQNDFKASQHYEVSGDMVHGIGTNRPGAEYPIFSETQNKDPVSAHRILAIADSLAIHALCAKLDPSLTTDRLGAIASLLEASSNVQATSLEGTLAALGKLFGKSYSSVETTRDDLYTNLADLLDDDHFKSLIGKVTIELATTDLDVRARTDFSALVSLITLSPIVLSGSSALLEGALGTVWSTEFSQWQADAMLTAEQRDAGQANFSDQYLSDRATMLAWRLNGNQQDALSSDQTMFVKSTQPGISDIWQFTDIASNSTVEVSPTFPQGRHKVVFGNEENNSFTGSMREDYLYGGGGNDALNGAAGHDYLEGNAGDDQLTGSLGNDILLGGAGDDNYRYATGDGLDTILDSDGKGRITMDGIVLAGGTQYGDERVHRDSDKHLYVQVDDKTLIIDGNIIVDNSVPSKTGGALGLNRQDAKAPSDPITTLSISGDIKPIDINANKPGIQAEEDAQHNPIGTAGAYEDILGGSTGSDHIVTGELNDDVGSGAGDDWIEGGTGSDYLHGEGGDDLIEGGSESDILIGEDGDDRLFGDARITVAIAITKGSSDVGSGVKGEWLSGNSGDDTLVAGADDDALAGGAGSDLLIAGAGDDNVFGDADYMAKFLTESNPRYSMGGTDWYHSSTDTYNWGYTDTGDLRTFKPVEGEKTPAGAAADVIYAGAGNDYVWAGPGNDVVFGESGDDKLLGEDDNDIILGGSGSDALWGKTGNDYLDGGAEADEIQGGEGDDVLIGGKGDDTLYGDEGQDTYLYNAGDGEDIISDTLAEGNILRFGTGINRDSIKLGLGSPTLNLDLGTGDTVEIFDFDRNDIFNSSSISRFEFADGSSLSTTELFAQGFDLDGTAGDDSLHGTNTVDRIDGKGGTDYLDGGAGDDTYFFAAGDSPTNELGQNEGIVDAIGMNTAVFEDVVAQDLALSSYDGEFLIIGYGPDDTLLVQGGFAGAVATYEFSNGERLSFTELIGRLFDGVVDSLTGAGQHVLVGGKTNDSLNGLNGGSLFSGGRGNDSLSGNGGGNTYLYSAGDGNDTIADHSKASGFMAANTLRFGTGITSADITLGAGSLLIRVGSKPDDAIHIEGFNPGDVFAQNTIDRFEFADGSILSYAQLLERGFDLTGSAGNDLLTGTNIGDRLDGGDGDDSLLGGSGDDTLTGGTGNDWLDGGSDNDVYAFGPGDGQDTISEAPESSPGKSNTLRLAAGINAEALALARSGADLVASIIGSTDQVTLKNFFLDNTPSNPQNPIQQIEFYDQTTWSLEDIVDHLTNNPPTGALSLSGSAAEHQVLYANNTLADPDGMGTMAYQWQSSPDGINWNVIDGATASSLTLTEAQVGQQIRVAASYIDGHGVAESVASPATAAIANVNDAPTGAVTVSGTATQNQTLTASNTLADIDGLGTIDYQWQASDDGSNWTVITGATASSLTLSEAQVGQQVRVAASYIDGHGTAESVASPATAAIAKADDDPVIANGGNGDDTLTGLSGHDQLNGGAGNDSLQGAAGNDTLIGGSGSDALYGGSGDDTLQLAVDGNWSAAYAAYNIGSPGQSGSGELVGISGKIRLFDLFDGGSGEDLLQGSNGNDGIFLDDSFSPLPGTMGPRLISVEAIRAGDGDDIVDLTSDRFVYGNVLLAGGNGNDLLWASAGNDVIEGGAANDRLFGGSGSDLLAGGSGADRLDGARGADLLIGGAGNDAIITGTGADLIAFNKGDGFDSITVGTGSKVLTLGGGIAYNNLALRKSGNDLMLDTGNGEGLSFLNWYAAATNQNVLTLQFVAQAMADFDSSGSDPLRDQKIEDFNFKGLVGAFDAALTATPTLSSWALTNALTQFHLAGSDNGALGGDLAYQYGLNGTLTDIGVSAAQQVLGEAGFGSQAQPLQPLAGLQVGRLRLA